MSWNSSLKSINLDAGNFHKLWFSIDESLVFVENICKSSAFSQINQKREALAVETVVEVIVVVVPLLKQNLGGVTCLPALPVQPPVSTRAGTFPTFFLAHLNLDVKYLYKQHL